MNIINKALSSLRDNNLRVYIYEYIYIYIYEYKYKHIIKKIPEGILLEALREYVLHIVNIPLVL